MPRLSYCQSCSSIEVRTAGILTVINNNKKKQAQMSAAFLLTKVFCLSLFAALKLFMDFEVIDLLAVFVVNRIFQDICLNIHQSIGVDLFIGGKDH